MKRKIKIEESSGNVFRDLGFDEAEAENLRLRSVLMIRITRMVRVDSIRGRTHLWGDAAALESIAERQDSVV